MRTKKQDLISVMERANRIASMTSLEDLLGKMLELILDVSGATNGTLYLLDHEAGELVFMVVRGEPEDQGLVGMRIKENVGIVGAAIQQAKPIVIEDLANDPRWYREIDPELTADLHNAITLPLFIQAKTIGAVQLFNYEHEELELLQLLGNRMASEVDKVLLLEKTRNSNKRLQSLVDMMGQMGAILDRDQLLGSLTENVTRLLDAERSSILLIDEAEESGAQIVSKTYSLTDKSKRNGDSQDYPDSTSRSSVTVPLRTRPILVGKERSMLEERTIGALMAFDRIHGVFDSEDTQLLGILAGQISTILQIATLYGQADDLFLDFINVLVATIDAKDPYTRGHSKRVSEISVSIAQAMGLAGDKVHDIRLGSLLHDIGKIHIPDHLLNKPERLSSDEYDMVKTHPNAGYQIMKEVRLLHNVLPAIIEHHERLDGSGYPLGLSSEQISLMGRIVSVADVYDAITSDRPYRKAMEVRSAIQYMNEYSGVYYDQSCVHLLSDKILGEENRKPGNNKQL